MIHKALILHVLYLHEQAGNKTGMTKREISEAVKDIPISERRDIVARFEEHDEDTD